MMIVSGSGLAGLHNNRMKATQSNVQKAFQRLSTGKKISTASDDVAGLAISQKMLALIRGSQQAHRNVQDANSLVQVADGAMDEVTNIVHRIRELTVQATNDTNTNSDKLIIQNEIDELKKGLSDIVHNTEFNTMKLLTNKEVGEYITEDRVASKDIKVSEATHLRSVDQNYNNVGIDELPQNIVSVKTMEVNLQKSTSVHRPKSFIGSTVVDYRPEWSADGEKIVFTSSRDGGQYLVAADGSSDPVIKADNIDTVGQKTVTTNNLMQLRNVDSTLILESRESTSDHWTRLQTYDYNDAYDGNKGYSFSPVVDEEGNTSFVFSDVEGNLQRVDVNVDSQTVISPKPFNLISSTDTLNLPPTNNTMTLPSTPDLYRMNTDEASFRIQKVNDVGYRELTYWDGEGTEPVGGYYTVSGNNVTFHGDAIIGAEGVDDAQDFYTFEYVTDGVQNDVYKVSIPSNAEVYNMNGEAGPRSLNILVGGKTVSKEHLLSERPEDVEEIKGVFVDAVSGNIEFYGDLRPAYNEEVHIEYMHDVDGQNDIHTFNLSSAIDTYNLTDPDLETNRSLRVYIDDQEVAYSEENGYTYDPESGRISLHGDARPDVPSDPSIRVEYINDTSYSDTSSEVYGIPLTSYPEIYNLEDEDAEPKSIRVFRNGNEEIMYSDTDGFQYNQDTNTIELYGTSRPNTGDQYSVHLITATGGVTSQDEIVEVELTHHPETYGITDPTIPSTFRVLVDGQEIDYDETKTDGFYYNSQTNRVEIYGDSRPDAGDPSNPDVRVYYVYESPATIVGNDSYDFQLAADTLDYGVESQSEPRAIRVYQSGIEVPYDEENGFTYDPSTNRLSLHGDSRPDIDNNTGDFRVYSIRESDLMVSVESDSYIYKVELNGQEIEQAEDINGDGYYFDGNSIVIVGDARPDITNSTEDINLNVLYSDPLHIGLDSSAIQGYLEDYCDEVTDTRLLAAEINPDSLVVSLGGNQLSSDQYELRGSQVVLKSETLDLTVGNHELKVDYEVRHSDGYKPNEYTFQVGANSGETLQVGIASFNNLLRDTNFICVRTNEFANQSLKIADDALRFVIGERGQMGAKMSRLDAIAANLKVYEENMTAAMSRIEDIDVAKETINLVKQQLLTQAQQAMSTHIKQSSQQVLQLLE